MIQASKARVTMLERGYSHLPMHRPLSNEELQIPWHGFRADFATHCPRPRGAGEEAGGRAGWGLRASPYGVETGKGAGPFPAWR